MTDHQTYQLAENVITRAATAGKRIATAESCTGGLIAAALTDIPGASDVFTHGFVTYANEAKEAMLGVPYTALLTHGAVSAPVALAMAKGARAAANADIAISVTGIAGPGGGTPEKPVGLVYIGIANGDRSSFHRHLFAAGSREYIRSQTVKAALRYLAAGLSA
ncbi:CinA family protein [Parvularcula marina]|uniref:CinA family protein n=1 Tax=Parvularcula marina TaxID=2292771 RepID=UPI00351727C9